MRTNRPCTRATYWGRGGAGVLFTCSEDNTVLLLLRAEWVEQGGTWGIPGGGIGEGHYVTPMQPITDLAVFRRKAEEEVEEECGGLPPGMRSIPEGLPFTEYEDCGFRYVTFIVDLTKSQKDAWAPFSDDGENDAFVWFPLDKVRAGRPLPDENGDLHDIHFGVNFTMQNMPAKTNPMRFESAYKQEEEEALKGSRAVRSIFSTALQRKSTERMVNSPHNFIVFIRQPDVPERPPIFNDAVTLVITPQEVVDIEARGRSRSQRESLYTAFTYLHRFGDIVTGTLLGVDDVPPYAPLMDRDRRRPSYDLFYTMFDDHMRLLRPYTPNNSKKEAFFEIYTECLRYAVNSKMVREGYSSGWEQSFADLFALCELTPPSRPLLLPIDTGGYPGLEAFNESIVPDFNVRFRAFYNDIVPRYYGSAQWI